MKIFLRRRGLCAGSFFQGLTVSCGLLCHGYFSRSANTRNNATNIFPMGQKCQMFQSWKAIRLLANCFPPRHGKVNLLSTYTPRQGVSSIIGATSDPQHGHILGQARGIFWWMQKCARECLILNQTDFISSHIADVNECLGNPCGTNALCFNNIGSFQCVCPAGFVGNPLISCCKFTSPLN